MEEQKLLGHFLALRNPRVVQVGVQQDRREGQDIHSIFVGKGFAHTEEGEQMSRECFHDSINALRFSGKFELAKKHAQGRVKFRIFT